MREDLVVIGDTAGMSDDEFSKTHTNGMSGSKVGSAMGLNPFTSPMALYAEETSGVKKKMSEDQRIRLQVGHYVEPVIADTYALEHPDVDVINDTRVFQHPEHPYFTANVDRVLRFPDGTEAILEIKSVSLKVWPNYWGKNPSIIPAYNEMQGRSYMGTLGVDKCVFAAMCSFNKTDRVYVTIDRDMSKENFIFDYLDQWEDHISRKDDSMARRMMSVWANTTKPKAGSVAREMANALKGIPKNIVPVHLEDFLLEYIEDYCKQQEIINEAKASIKDAENKQEEALAHILPEMGVNLEGEIDGFYVRRSETPHRTILDQGRSKDFFKDNGGLKLVNDGGVEVGTVPYVDDMMNDSGGELTKISISSPDKGDDKDGK